MSSFLCGKSSFFVNVEVYKLKGPLITQDANVASLRRKKKWLLNYYDGSLCETILYM